MDMTLSEWFETQNFPAEDENLASSSCLYLKKGAGRSLKSGGGWVYDNEVDRTEGFFDNGAILKILDFDGFPLGYGFINTASKIRVRMLSRYEKNGITPAFLRQRVRDAWTYRKAVIRIHAGFCSGRRIFCLVSRWISSGMCLSWSPSRSGRSLTK